jgi:hypothetical protein
MCRMASPVDVGKLPVTNKPANFLIPNIWIPGEDAPSRPARST